MAPAPAAEARLRARNPRKYLEIVKCVRNWTAGLVTQWYGNA